MVPPRRPRQAVDSGAGRSTIAAWPGPSPLPTSPRPPRTPTPSRRPPMAAEQPPLTPAGGPPHGDALFRLLVEAVTDSAIFLLDPAGRVASWNAGAQRIHGHAAENVVGKSFSRFYTPEDVAKGHPQRGLQLALEQGRQEEEGERVRQGGARFWAVVTVTALRDEQGAHVGFAVVTRDISHHRQAEDELRREREFVRLVLDTDPSLIFVK